MICCLKSLSAIKAFGMGVLLMLKQFFDRERLFTPRTLVLLNGKGGRHSSAVNGGNEGSGKIQLTAGTM